MIKLGSHVSFKSPNYLYDSIKESIKNGANCAMIFLGAPQNTKRVDFEKYQYEKYLKDFSNLIKPEDIVVHAPYIINPASLEKADFAISFLSSEIKRMDKAKFKYLVLHPGFYGKNNVKDSLDQLARSIQKIFEITKDSNVEIMLETMSGKGSEVGKSYEEILYVIDKVKSPRLGACLDTCHVWDAGYNINDYQVFKDELIKTGILKHIKVIHLNDSKNELGSHKDRHANIDKGLIGLKNLKRIVHDPIFENIPIILETPWTEKGPIYDQDRKSVV